MVAPKVTTIIAHHNYEEYLPQALDSVLSQTYQSHICIVDDSSDNREEVINIVDTKLGKPKSSFQKDNILFRSGKNYSLLFLMDGPFGPSLARNVGIKHCWENTDIFAVLDADDEMFPTKIEKCVNTIMLDPQNIGSAYGDTLIENTVTGTQREEFREPYSKWRLNQECIIHSGSVINKLALQATAEQIGEDVQFYDNEMRTCEDYDLWMRISERFIIMHVPEILTKVRVQPKNSTDTVAKEIWQRNWQRVMLKVQARGQNKS